MVDGDFSSSASTWKTFFSTINDDNYDGSAADILLNDSSSEFKSMIFAKLVFFLEKDTIIENNNILYAALPYQIRMYGGTVVCSVDDSTITHVVKYNENFLAGTETYNRKPIRICNDGDFEDNNNMQYRQYVNVEWVEKCISEKMLISTQL